MKTFGWSRDYCLDDLDGAEGWVWFNFATMNEARILGNGMKINGDGYIAVERKKLLEQRQKPKN